MSGPRDEASEADRIERARYTASLRVSTARLSLPDLTHCLGHPSDGHDIGDPISTRRPDSGVRREAVWLLNSSIEQDRPLEDHIEELVAFVDRRRDTVAELRQHCAIDIFCGVFRGTEAANARPEGFIVFGCGFSLEPGLMARLGERDLPLVVDIQ